MNDNKRGIGLSFAINGLKNVFVNERNFKIHLLMGLIVMLISIYLKLSYIEWVMIILVIGLVLITEIINSAIEKLIDYVKPEIHPTAKVIKDTMAGAVLISAIVSILVGTMIFIPKLITLFQ